MLPHLHHIQQFLVFGRVPLLNHYSFFLTLVQKLRREGLWLGWYQYLIHQTPRFPIHDYMTLESWEDSPNLSSEQLVCYPKRAPCFTHLRYPGLFWWLRKARSTAMMQRNAWRRANQDLGERQMGAQLCPSWKGYLKRIKKHGHPESDKCDKCLVSLDLHCPELTFSDYICQMGIEERIIWLTGQLQCCFSAFVLLHGLAAARGAHSPSIFPHSYPRTPTKLWNKKIAGHFGKQMKLFFWCSLPQAGGDWSPP